MAIIELASVVRAYHIVIRTLPTLQSDGITPFTVQRAGDTGEAGSFGIVLGATDSAHRDIIEAE